MSSHGSSSLLRTGLADITTITALFLASGTHGASLPAQFRGEYENLKAGFTNVMEKVEGTRIGRGVVDAQELLGIARAVKSLSVEVNTFVSARDDEFHRSGSAHYFTMARRVWQSDRHSLVFTMLAKLLNDPPPILQTPP